MNTNKRDFLMDNIKGILMFLVVFGHSLELFKDDFTVAGIIYTFIYLFHMPVFIFVSGYFSKNAEKCRATAVKKYLVPYLFFNTIWSILSFAAGATSGVSIFTPGWALWYLFSMFIWKILLIDMVKLRHVFAISLLFGVFASMSGEFGTFMSLGRTVAFLPFFLAGYFMDDIQLEKLKKCPKILSVVLLLCGALLAVLAVTSELIPTEILWADKSFVKHGMNMIPGFAVSIMRYVCGFAFVLIMVNLVPKKKIFALSKVGKNTLPIYILHTYLLCVVVATVYFIEPGYLKIIVSFVGSGAVIYALSGNRLNQKFSDFIDKIIKITVHKGGKPRGS